MANVLDGRTEVYGESWQKVGQMAKPVVQELMLMLMTFPEGWLPWIQILHKLCRLLGTPRHVDSWKDIVGYATLVVGHLEKHAHR